MSEGAYDGTLQEEGRQEAEVGLRPWLAQPGPQLEAIRKHWVEELFYGGAVGGGKTDFLIGDFAQDVPTYGSAWKGILFRKHYGDLEFIIERTKRIYPSWFPGATYHPGDKRWDFGNGATLLLRQLDHINDYEKYMGMELTWIAWDELPQWESLKPYLQMKSRLRSSQHVPNKRIRATGNPGGRSHSEVKKYFGIDRWPNGGVVFQVGADKSRRIFIKSRLTDNKILMASDPDYIHRLEGLGSPELVKAWRDGNWDVVTGAYFTDWDADKHVIQPVPLPEHWVRLRGFDWGYSSPAACLWAAVSDGSLPQFPRGALVVYREVYVTKKTDEELADLINDRSFEKVDVSVADPSVGAHRGGPTTLETFAGRGLHFINGDNNRIAGWSQLRNRLKGDHDGRPMLYVFSTCTNLIEELPALQHDSHKPEDVDTDSRDHAADALRYICMSRPWVREPEKPQRQKDQEAVKQFAVKRPTFQELMQRAKKLREETA